MSGFYFDKHMYPDLSPEPFWSTTNHEVRGNAVQYVNINLKCNISLFLCYFK